MADGIICRGVLNTKLPTLLEEANKCLHRVQCYTPDITHFYLCGRIYYTDISFTISLLFTRYGIHLVQLA